MPWVDSGKKVVRSQENDKEIRHEIWNMPLCFKISQVVHVLYVASSHYLAFSVQFSRSVMSDSLQPHELQHARPPCPSPTPRVHPNPCPLCWWCHPTISSSVVPFSSCPQSFPASGSFQMSQLSTSGGQSIGISASTSVPPLNIQDWSPLGRTGWISLQSYNSQIKINRIYAFWRNLPKRDIMENSLIRIKPYEKQSIKC